MSCIWCQQPITDPSEEHGIPDAVGCPPAFILPDAVCRSCNNKLGRVDQALVKQFEVIALLHGIRGKKGRPAGVNSWRGLSGTWGVDGASLGINAGPANAEFKGKSLRAPSRASGIHGIWADPASGKMGFKQQFGGDKRFVPALFKIGLNAVAYHLGADTAASPDYDHVRAFVLGRTGAPELKVMMLAGPPGAIETHVSGPHYHREIALPVLDVTILGVSFIVDMSPDQQALGRLQVTADRQGETFLTLPPALAA